jgi:hypothetical protein
MIREIEVPDSEGDEDVRPKKKTKGSTAAKSLIPRDEGQEKTPPGETNDLRQEKGNDGGKEKKAKKGVLLRGAVNDLQSDRVVVTGSASAPRADLGKPDKPKQYVCSHLLNMSMLTLSQPTLYYWNLSGDMIKKDGIIRNWATTVSKLSSSSRPTSSSRTFTHHTSTQVTSRHSTTSKSGAKNANDLSALSEKSQNDTDQESKGAFSDNDETVRKERDAAINSPPKNGARATNSVCISPSLMYYTC